MFALLAGHFVTLSARAVDPVRRSSLFGFGQTGLADVDVFLGGHSGGFCPIDALATALVVALDIR
jgi:hypothetical protein